MAQYTSINLVMSIKVKIRKISKFGNFYIIKNLPGNTEKITVVSIGAVFHFAKELPHSADSVFNLLEKEI